MKNFAFLTNKMQTL